MVRKLEGTEKRSKPQASSSYVMGEQTCSVQDGSVSSKRAVATDPFQFCLARTLAGAG